MVNEAARSCALTIISTGIKSGQKEKTERTASLRLFSRLLHGFCVACSFSLCNSCVKSSQSEIVQRSKELPDDQTSPEASTACNSNLAGCESITLSTLSDQVYHSSLCTVSCTKRGSLPKPQQHSRIATCFLTTTSQQSLRVSFK